MHICEIYVTQRLWHWNTFKYIETSVNTYSLRKPRAFQILENESVTFCISYESQFTMLLTVMQHSLVHIQCDESRLVNADNSAVSSWPWPIEELTLVVPLSFV